MIAGAAEEQGQLERAQRLLEESLREFSELGDQNYVEATSRIMTGIFYDLGDKERARASHLQSLERARAQGSLEQQVDVAGTLAEYDLEDGDVERARPFLLESLRAARHLLANRLEPAMAVRRAAWALALGGRPSSAAKLLACSESVREEVGFSRSWFGPLKEEQLDRIRGQLDEEEFAKAWEVGRKLTVPEALDIALTELEQDS